MARLISSLNKTPDSYACACHNMETNQTTLHGYVANAYACEKICKRLMNVSAGGGLASMRRATGLRTGEPTRFQRRRKGGTGQPVVWKNAGGTILGLTTYQALIAVAVGVAAYFIIQKVK